MSVISITFAQCDGIEQKLRKAGVIETVDLESRGLLDDTDEKSESDMEF